MSALLMSFKTLKHYPLVQNSNHMNINNTNILTLRNAGGQRLSVQSYNIY